MPDPKPQNPQEQNLAKLESILKLIESGISQEDFVAAFENVVELVLKIEKRNSSFLNTIEDRIFQDVKDLIKNDAQIGLTDLENRSQYFLADAKKVLSDARAAIDEKVRQADVRIKNLKDGPQGPPGRPGRDGSPDSPKDVRDKLLQLNGDERLPVSAIKGLDDYEEVRNRKPSIISGAAPGATTVQFTDLSSQLNGSRKTFTVPRRRFIALFGTEFPVIYRPEIDYTGTGTYTLTLTSQVSAPASGQSLLLLHSRV